MYGFDFPNERENQSWHGEVLLGYFCSPVCRRDLRVNAKKQKEKATTNRISQAMRAGLWL